MSAHVYIVIYIYNNIMYSVDHDDFYIFTMILYIYTDRVMENNEDHNPNALKNYVILTILLFFVFNIKLF